MVKKAEEMDLLTYLQNYEPHELVKIGNETYTTKTHDSIRISNGLWNWRKKCGFISYESKELYFF